MREIILISSKEEKYVKSLVVSEINLIDFDVDYRNIDALIFTSKYAVQSTAKNAQRINNYSWQRIPSYVIGDMSAKYVKELGGIVEYVGKDSHGDGFANELLGLLKNKHPLYIHARKIVSNINEKLIANKIKLSEVVAYENTIKKLDSKDMPPPNSILIFTAPSHYKAFLANFKWDGSYIAVGIGMTTFRVFDVSVNAFVSPKQTIKDCIKFAEELRLRLP